MRAIKTRLYELIDRATSGAGGAGGQRALVPRKQSQRLLPLAARPGFAQEPLARHAGSPFAAPSPRPANALARPPPTRPARARAAPAEYLSAPNHALNIDVTAAINGAPDAGYAATKACKRIKGRLVLKNPRVQQLALQVRARPGVERDCKCGAGPAARRRPPGMLSMRALGRWPAAERTPAASRPSTGRAGLRCKLGAGVPSARGGGRGGRQARTGAKPSRWRSALPAAWRRPHLARPPPQLLEHCVRSCGEVFHRELAKSELFVELLHMADRTSWVGLRACALALQLAGPAGGLHPPISQLHQRRQAQPPPAPWRALLQAWESKGEPLLGGGRMRRAGRLGKETCVLLHTAQEQADAEPQQISGPLTARAPPRAAAAAVHRAAADAGAGTAPGVGLQPQARPVPQRLQ